MKIKVCTTFLENLRVNFRETTNVTRGMTDLNDEPAKIPISRHRKTFWQDDSRLLSPIKGNLDNNFLKNVYN